MSDPLGSELAGLHVDAPATLEDAVLSAVGLVDRYVTRHTILGDVFVAFNDRGVSAVDIAGDAARFERGFLADHGRRAIPAEVIPERIDRHLDTAMAAGRPGRLSIDLRGLTEFQTAVLRRTATIPRGQVRPYGWIAREIGTPAAVRAVGSALARNPVPMIIPCHRVVRSDGTLGEYSLGGAANKRALLESEGVDFASLVELAGRGVRFLGSDTTGVFCHPTCGHARRIAGSHRHEFADEGEARAAGYRPCRVCRPATA